MKAYMDALVYDACWELTGDREHDDCFKCQEWLIEAWERMTTGGLNLHWLADCQKWRGVLLVGDKRHWCFDWDGLPVDETCSEYPCACFPLERAHAAR